MFTCSVLPLLVTTRLVLTLGEAAGAALLPLLAQADASNVRTEKRNGRIVISQGKWRNRVGARAALDVRDDNA